MKVTRILAAVALVAGFAGAAQAQQGCARLSWNSCDPWNENANFGLPGVYLLIESAFGVTDPNVAHDSNLRIGQFSSDVPDAWRFDDAGCQTSLQATYDNKSFSKACPTLLGPAPLPLTNANYDPGTKTLTIRLSVAYDTFTPSPSLRYTLWRLTFDHTFSNAGPTPPDRSTCGGAELCQNLALDYAFYLNTANIHKDLVGCDTDSRYPAGVFASGFATWNGGCLPVAAQPSTWGRVKGLYH